MAENQQDNNQQNSYGMPNFFLVQRVFDCKYKFVKLEISDYEEMNTIIYKSQKDKTCLNKWVSSKEGNPKIGLRKVEYDSLDELTKTLMEYDFEGGLLNKKLDLLKKIGGNLYFYKGLRFEVKTKVR